MKKILFTMAMICAATSANAADLFKKEGDFVLVKVYVLKDKPLEEAMHMDTTTGLTVEKCQAEALEFIAKAEESNSVQNANVTCTWAKHVIKF